MNEDKSDPDFDTSFKQAILDTVQQNQAQVDSESKRILPQVPPSGRININMSEASSQTDMSSQGGLTFGSRDMSQPLPVEVPPPQTFKAKVGRHKIKILVIIIIALIIALIVVLLTRKDTPQPKPPVPPPTPPIIPIDEVNPYGMEKYSTSYTQYKVTGSLVANETIIEMLEKNQHRGNLEVGAGQALQANPWTIPLGQNNDIVRKIDWEVGQIDSYRLYANIFKPNDYEPPVDVVKKPSNIRKQYDFYKLTQYGFNYTTIPPWGFELVDPMRNGSDDLPLLSSKNQTLVFMDKYIQFDMLLPTKRVFGLGEREREQFMLEDGTWTLWANGTQPGTATTEDDGSGGKAGFGVHPFAMVQTQTKGKFMGIFFRNTHLMSPVIRTNKNGRTVLSYISNGGMIEMYFIFNSRPKHIIDRYLDMVGRPTLPPFWGLGWHIGSHRYNTQQIYDDLETNFTKYDFPIEGYWIDSQVLSKNADFRVEESRYPFVKSLRQFLALRNKKLILNAPNGLMFNSTNQGDFFLDASEYNLLMKSAINKDKEQDQLISQMGNDGNLSAVFDFFNPKSYSILKRGLDQFQADTLYDGLNLENNAYMSQCDGECPPQNSTPLAASPEDDKNQSTKSHGWWKSYQNQDIGESTYWLPFIPGTEQNLDHQTLSLNATSPSNSKYSQYATHNLNGHLQARAFWNVSQQMKTDLPFLMSESTFSGSGQYTGHIVSKNRRDGIGLKQSIVSIMNFNMYGIPFTGADVCGNIVENIVEQEFEMLCARWIQLATFYPFARMNSYDGQPNEPFLFNEPWKTLAQNAMFDRLKYTRFMYTCLFGASNFNNRSAADTCFDHLIFHYEHNDDVFDNVRAQDSFMVGDSLLVHPVLYGLSGDTFKAFFPNDRNSTWVSMNNFTEFVHMENNQSSKIVNLKAPNGENDTVQVFLRPGRIVPVNDNKNKQYKTTADLRKPNSVVSLIVNGDKQGFAEGYLFLNNDDSVSKLENQQYEYYQFVLQKKSIYKYNKNKKNTSPTGTNIDKIVLLNAVTTSTTDFACVEKEDGTKESLNYQYDKDQMTMTFTNKTGNAINVYNLQAIFFGDEDKELNFCNQSIHFYRYANAPPPREGLSTAQMKFDVTSMKPGSVRDLTIDARMLEGGILNFDYTYANLTGVDHMPFPVPGGITDIDRNKIDESYSIDDYISFSQLPTGAMQTVIKNKVGTPLVKFNGFIVDEFYHFASFDAVYNDSVSGKPGIIGTFGQKSEEMFVANGVFNFWNRDNTTQYNKTTLVQNMQQSSPYFISQASDGSWYGMYLHNLAAGEWIIKDDPVNKKVNIEAKSLGGIGDFYFIFGNTSRNQNEQILDIMQKFHKLVGLPAKIPLWGLGWQYDTQNICTDSSMCTYEFYRNFQYKLAIDGVHFNPSYTDNFMDFTVDNTAYVNFMVTSDWFHSAGVKVVTSLLPGITYRPYFNNYTALHDGLEKNVFLKTKEGQLVFGQSFGNEILIPDFVHPNTTNWYLKHLQDLWVKMEFDGFRTYYDSSLSFCKEENCIKESLEHPQDHYLAEQLKYLPRSFKPQRDAILFDGWHAQNISELDFHSCYGSFQAIITQNYFQTTNQTDRRPLTYGSSSTVGYNQYAVIFNQDNESTEKDLKNSITQIMRYGISSNPLAGTSVCGYYGNITFELCTRWYYVAAFQPISINANHDESIQQQPATFTRWKFYEGSISWLSLCVEASWIKQSLLKYMYSYFDEIHRVGGLYYKPLFVDFPDDPYSYNTQNVQNLLVGRSLLVHYSPTLDQNMTEFYFPPGQWCNIDYKKDIANQLCVNSTSGLNVTRPSKIYDYYIHLKGKRMIVYQNITDIYAADPYAFQTMEQLLTIPVHFLILPSCNDSLCLAEGIYTNDDGLTKIRPDKYNQYELGYKQDLTTQDKNLTVSYARVNKATNYTNEVVNTSDKLQSVVIYNASAMGLNETTYSVQQVFDNQTAIAVGEALYNTTMDRLIWYNKGSITMPGSYKLNFYKQQ